MSFINHPSLLTPFVKGLLTKALESEPQDGLTQFIQTDNSTQRFEDYTVVGAAPILREYVGDIRTEGMTDAQIRITPGLFRTKIIVKKEDLEDDQLGAIRQRVSDIARGAWRQRRIELIGAVTGNAAWPVDNTAFFADARPARGLGAAYDNNLAGSGTTAANIGGDLQTAIAALSTFQDEQGQPFNEDASTIGILAPPSLKVPFMQVLGNGQVSGTNQVFGGMARFVPVFDGRLTGNTWYAFNLSGAQKPILFVDRVGLEMGEFYKDFVWEYSFRARNRAAMVHPQLGVRINN
jgi:phage major head subunit gpT-like protein